MWASPSFGALAESLRELLEAQLDTSWVSSVRKAWQVWFRRTDEISRLRGEEGYRQARAFLEEGIQFIESLRRTLVTQYGVSPRLVVSRLSGKKRKDVRGLPKGTVARNVVELFHDFEDAVTEVGKRLVHIDHWYNVLYNPGVFPGGLENVKRTYPDAGHPVFGMDRNLNALDAELEALTRDLKRHETRMAAAFRTLAAMVKAAPVDEKAEAEFNIGRMRVMVEVPPMVMSTFEKSDAYLTAHEIAAGRDNLKAAHDLIRRAGFDDLWYGVLVFHPPIRSYQFTGPGSGKQLMAAGNYAPGPAGGVGDMVRLMINPAHPYARDVVIHELGHRLYFRCMGASERQQFNAGFKGTPAVTQYGGENAIEDFAELFLWYVTRRELTQDQRRRFEAVMASLGNKIRC